MSFSNEEKSFYARQMRVPMVGEAGQEKLKNSKVVIVGAGGLGHPAATYLAAAGVGELVIVDADNVEISNLHRQVLFSPEHQGLSKAQVVAQRLRQQNPWIKVQAMHERVTANNVESILRGAQVVVDGTDNFNTKFLLHDTCFFKHIDLVMASVSQLDGRLNVFPFSQYGVSPFPCLRCLYPKPPQDGCVGTCQQNGVLGILPGIFGLFEANEVIKLILGASQTDGATSLTFDLMGFETGQFKWRKLDTCCLCGTRPSIISSNDSLKHSWVIEHERCLTENFVIIDIRNEPVSDTLFMDRRRYALLCTSGIRAYKMASELRAKGFNNIFVVRGGENACHGL